jgi:hypothetical protein
MNLFNAKVPSNCASGPSAFLAMLWIQIRIRIRIDLRHFGSLYPDPHQIKIRIRIQ